MSRRPDEPIRTLIVDDEPLGRNLIARLLVGNPKFEVVGLCANGEEALAAFRRSPPDLVFLDIEMPDLSGFEVLERLGAARMPYVVFVTAYDHYAIRAFRVHALDYLLKPVELDQFAACLERAEEALRQSNLSDLASRVLRLAAAEGALDGGRDDDDGALTFNHRGRLVRLAPRDIVWLEAANQYVTVHATEETYLLSRSLTALEKALPAPRFLRVHRSALVNLRFVAEVRPAGFGTHWIVLSTGARLRLARARRDLLDRLLAAASS